MTLKKLLFAAAMLALSLNMSAQQSYEINLWPNGPAVKSSDAGDTAKVKVFLPEKKSATGRAVVICPGGGYQHLAMNHEGYDWAPFFNNMGIAAIVLKYRMPHGEKDVPISDAEEAIRLRRSSYPLILRAYRNIGKPYTMAWQIPLLLYLFLFV